MKTRIKQILLGSILRGGLRRVILLFTAVALFMGCSKPPESAIAQNAMPAPVSAKDAAAPKPTFLLSNRPVSVFTTTVDRVQTPMFIGADKRSPARQDSQNETAGNKADRAVEQPLKLNAIFKMGARASALINDTCFHVGEIALVPMGTQSTNGRTSVSHVAIRCVEIAANAVVVEVKGETTPRVLRMASFSASMNLPTNP